MIVANFNMHLPITKVKVDSSFLVPFYRHTKTPSPAPRNYNLLVWLTYEKGLHYFH
jgi:hypothetical protein